MSDSPDGRSVPRSSLTMASLVAGVGFCLKSLLVICVPVRALAMTPWLPDDAFIYAAIARNLATGGGYSLDGQTPTAGAPLLWTWILAMFHAGLSDDASIKAALLLGSALSALSAIIVFSIAWEYSGRITAWISLALSVFMAPVFLSAINGMETSLFTFLGLVVVWLHVSRWGRGLLRRSSLTRLASGIVQGLMFLTRADAMFIVFAVFITELRFARVDKFPLGRRALGLIAIGFVICCLPSLAWNYHATGSVFPSNQVGRRMLAWEGVYGATGIALGLVRK